MSPQVFHILSDGTDSSSGTMQMFLDDKGWPGAQFRCHVDSTFIPNVQSGSSTIATPLIESPDASYGSPNGINLLWDGTNSAYTWVDVQIGADQTGICEPKIRFVFREV